MLEAIRDLLTILEWRATELTISRLLGSLVGIDLFMLAVKHPVLTAVRVLLDDGVPAYVSHSISEPRRAWERTGGWPPFMKEVQRFSNRLSKPGEHSSKGLIPICPTSIDERRIASGHTAAGADLLVPSLLDRWEIATEEILVAPPKYDEGEGNWLDPCGYFDKYRPFDSPLPAELEPELRAVDGLLRALRTRIDNQINARDHTLVSQCPFFVVYRPYEAWRVTSGVAAEITHRQRLKKEGKAVGRTLFLHSMGDDKRRKLRVIAEECASFFAWTEGPNEVASERVVTLLMESLSVQPPASSEPQDISEHVKSQLDKANVKYGGPRFAPEQGVLEKVTSAETEEAAGERWNRISKDAKRRDTWKDSADEWYIGKNLSPEAFADKANELACKNLK